MTNVFGDLTALPGSDNDTFALASEIAHSTGPRPRLYQCCGTEDFLYNVNVKFRDHARKLGLDLTYEEGPGEHEWGYWDKQIQHVLAWLPLAAA
jgi:putative tributyrin esterase